MACPHQKGAGCCQACYNAEKKRLDQFGRKAVEDQVKKGGK